MSVQLQPTPFGPSPMPQAARRIGRALKKVAVWSLQWLIGIPLTLLFLTLVFGPPLSLIWETIDLVRMRERTVGRVDAVGAKSDYRGTSRPDIEYHFTANGRKMHSTRYAPDFVAN